MIAVSLNVGGGVRLIKPAKLCMCSQTLQTQWGRTHGAGCVRQWFRTAEPLGERRYENWNTHLESQGKVRELENKWLWQSFFFFFRKFIYSVQKEKGYSFLWDSLSPSPYSLRATLLGKNLLPWGANSFLLKVTPKFEVIQKWFLLVRGYGKTVKCKEKSGKSQGILR